MGEPRQPTNSLGTAIKHLQYENDDLTKNEDEMEDLANMMENVAGLRGEGVLLKEETDLTRLRGRRGARRQAHDLGVLIAEKDRAERMFSQEVSSLRMKIRVLKNQLASEEHAKELLQRNLDTQRTKLFKLKVETENMALSDVAELKEVHRLELAVADVKARVQNAFEGEHMAVSKMLETEKQLAAKELEAMNLMMKQAELEYSINAEKQKNKTLQGECETKEEELMRMNHATAVEIEGLKAVVQEKTAVATELQAEVNDSITEVKGMTKELETNMAQAEAQKLKLMQDAAKQQNELAKLQGTLNAALRQNKVLEDDIMASEAREKLMQNQLEGSQFEEKELQEQAEQTSRTLRLLETEVHTVTAANNNIAESASKFKGEADVLADRIGISQIKYRKMSRAVHKENILIKELESNLRNIKLEDEDKMRELAASGAYTDDLQDKTFKKGEEVAQVKAQLGACEERIDTLSETFAEEKKILAETKAKLGSEMKAVEGLNRRLREGEAAFVYDKHVMQLEMRKAKVQIDDRSVELKNVERRVAEQDQLSRAHRQRIATINEEALQVKGVLEKALTNVIAKKSSLEKDVEDVTREEINEKAMIDGMIDAQAELFAALVDIEKDIAHSTATHIEEIARIDAEIAKENENAEFVVAELNAAKADKAAVDERMKKAEDQMVQLQAQVEDERMKGHATMQKLLDMEKLEGETKAEIESATRSLETVTKSLTHKLDENSLLRRELVEAEATVKKAQLCLAERAKDTYRVMKTLDVEKRAIRSLHEELTVKDGVFDSNSMVVKQKFNRLQSALKERADAIRMLERGNADSLANNRHLQERVSNSRVAAERQHNTLQQLIVKEMEKTQEARDEIQRRKLNVHKAEVELNRTDAVIRSMMAKSEDLNDEFSVLSRDLELERDRSNVMQEKLDKRFVYEEDAAKAIQAKDELIINLKCKVKVLEIEEKKLLKNVQAEELQMKDKKKTLIKANDKQRALVEEFDAARNEFARIGSAKADTTEGLEAQFDRAHAAQAEYHGTLEKMLKNDLIDIDDAL